jgi:hypothetical protein
LFEKGMYAKRDFSRVVGKHVTDTGKNGEVKWKR